MFLPLILCSCVAKPGSAVSAAEQVALTSEVESYRAFALEPAHQAPPAVRSFDGRVDAGPASVHVRWRAPEDASWNRWEDGTARLFNDRVAHVFEVDIEGPGLLGWEPSETMLELNSPSTRLVALADAEPMLADLLLLALACERQLVDVDLLARTRAAGAFRSAYLPPSGAERISGVVVFPLWSSDSTRPAWDTHVVAMRLRLRVTVDGVPHDATIVLD